MTLFISHRMERLIDRLAERLIGSNDNFTLLQESWVLLPSLVNKQWLMMELVERLPNQAMANVKFLCWKEALQQVCSSVHPVPSTLDLEISLSHFFLNNDFADDPDFSSLVNYLKSGKLPGVSFLSQIFSRQLKEGGFYGIKFTKPWQRKVYEMLTENGLWRFPHQLLEKAACEVPIHCFCVDDMPKIGWDFFLMHSTSPVSIYLFSPCKMYWEDVVSKVERCQITRRLNQKGVCASSLMAFEEYVRDTHPLLANWGRLGRETLKNLESHSLEMVEDYEGAEEDLEAAQEKFIAGRFSLLQIVQQDLLLLRSSKNPLLQRREDDRSIQVIAAGASRIREVQILKDHILLYLQGDQKKLSDVLVLAPNICLYEPQIRFVFEKEFAFHIHPVFALPQKSILQGILLFFEIAKRKWEVDAVLELFENVSFQKRQKITPDDLTWYSIWLKEAKVRGEFDNGRGSWIQGLKKMVLGLVYLLENEEIVPRVQRIDWNGAERLDQLIAIIHLIEKHIRVLQRKDRTLDEWAIYLKEMVTELFESQDGDDEIFQSFVRQLSKPVFKKSPFPFQVLQNILTEKCQQATTSERSCTIDAIQFSSLQPGAIRPANAIFMLGLDCESFPRKDIPASLDFEVQKVKDSDCDRYLFLEALFAAKERFWISYCHLSSEDGKVVEPSSVVQELLQVVDEYYSGKTSLTATHLALPYDERYFQKDEKICSFSQEAFQAASAKSVSPPIFWPKIPLDRKEIRVFDLSDFSLLARHPWKYFIERRLGIYLNEENLFSEKRLEDFTLPPYMQQQLLKLSLRQSVDEVVSKHEHLFIGGSFGEWAKLKLKRNAKDFQNHLQKWNFSGEDIVSVRLTKDCLKKRQLANGDIEAPPIVIPMNDGHSVEIVGEIDMVSPLGLLTLGDLSLFQIVRQWPSLLVLMAIEPHRASIFSLKKGASKSFDQIDAMKALKKWIDYAFLAQESLSPLIFPWVDRFIQKSLNEWKREAQKTLMKEDDLTIRWVLARSEVLPLDQIWEEWHSVVKELFSEMIEEDQNASV